MPTSITMLLNTLTSRIQTIRKVLQSSEWDTSYQVIAALERFASCEPAGIGVGEYFRAAWVRAAELVWVRCCDGREVIDGKGNETADAVFGFLLYVGFSS